MTFQATGTRVFVRKEEQVLQKGSLILAAPLNKQNVGIVVAVGPGKVTESGTLIPTQCKVGDRVVFNLHGGQTVDIMGEELTVFYDHDIYAILPKEENG